MKTRKRLLSILLALCMALSALPGLALAEDGTEDAGQTGSETETGSAEASDITAITFNGAQAENDGGDWTVTLTEEQAAGTALLTYTTDAPAAKLNNAVCVMYMEGFGKLSYDASYGHYKYFSSEEGEGENVYQLAGNAPVSLYTGYDYGYIYIYYTASDYVLLTVYIEGSDTEDEGGGSDITVGSITVNGVEAEGYDDDWSVILSEEQAQEGAVISFTTDAPLPRTENSVSICDLEGFGELSRNDDGYSLDVTPVQGEDNTYTVTAEGPVSVCEDGYYSGSQGYFYIYLDEEHKDAVYCSVTIGKIATEEQLRDYDLASITVKGVEAEPERSSNGVLSEYELYLEYSRSWTVTISASELADTTLEQLIAVPATDNGFDRVSMWIVKLDGVGERGKWNSFGGSALPSATFDGEAITLNSTEAIIPDEEPHQDGVEPLFPGQYCLILYLYPTGYGDYMRPCARHYIYIDLLEDEETETADTPVFEDVEGHWAEDAVAYVAGKGLMNGLSEGVFGPEGTATRAQIWTILARMAGEDTDGGATWYEKGQTWAVENGVSDGTDFNGSITREQFATMLWRNLGEPEAEGGLSAFPDAQSVSDYAAGAMAWAVGAGVMNGMDGALNPGGTATRAQIAAMIMRYTGL